MNGHCGYRSPLGSQADAGHILERPPIGWLCACPAGEHALGLNCIDNQARCKVARQYDRVGGTSINYSKKHGKRLIDEQHAAVESAIEGLPEELAATVRKTYRLPNTKKETAQCR